MRKITFLAGLALAVGVLLTGSALADVGGSDLPLKGSLSGSTTHSLATGVLHGQSTGTITHLGLATLVNEALIVPSGPITFDWSGTWTLTAADGDQMVGTSAGTLTRTDPTHVTAVIDYTSSGGTGRFADASAAWTSTVFSTRVAFDPPISYGVNESTLDGQLSW